MVKPTSLVWVLGAASLVSGWTLGEIRNSQPFKSPKVPGRYIIEYEESSSLSKRDGVSIQSALSNVGLDVSVNNEYDSNIFQGASIQIVNDNDTTVESLKNIQGVSNAWHASYITLDDTIQAANNPIWNPHSLTGVETLHKRGIKGKGITIAVVDSGVDYTHSALGGGIGEGYPIIGGYDFSNNPENPTNDPMDCAGHGTFVSSQIIANSDKMVGVAPEANIKMYKVFGCHETTSDDIVIAGLLKAYEEKPDLITLSLGSDQGYNTIPIAQISSKIAQEITIMYAAGNSGENGPFVASSGGSGIDVLAVGSTDASQMVSYKAIAVSSSGNSKEFGYVGNYGDPFVLDGTFDVVVTENDGCTSTEKFSEGSIVLAGRGNCYFGSLYSHLEKDGWTTALIYADSENSSVSYFSMRTSSSNTLTDFGQVSYDFAQWVVDEITSGKSVQITISSNNELFEMENTYVNAGQMSYFSSWGPTFENNFFPHVSAPGGDVFGAVIGGTYAVGSGTSFSCPYVAGLTALYLTENPNATPKNVRAALMGTASDVFLYKHKKSGDGKDRSTIDTSQKAPVIQQGAGFIDAVKMFDQGSKIVSTPFIELNDTANRVENFEITIKNDNSESVTYQITHVDSTTIDSKDSLTMVNTYFPPVNDASATVTFGQTSITVSPGGSATISVNIKIPDDADTSSAPIFAGKIWFTGDNGDSLSVPYMGIQVDSKSWSTFNEEPLVLGYDSETDWYFNLNDTTYEKSFDPSSGDSPLIIFKYVFGTEFTSFDLVDENFDLANYQYPLTAGKNGFYGSLRSQPTMFGEIISWPYEYVTRDNYGYRIGFYCYDDGSKILPGKYRVLSRALRIFGDRNNIDDWDLFLSGPFTVGEPTEFTSTESTKTVNPSDIPTAWPTGPEPTPTGEDYIYDINIVNRNMYTSESYKNDWFTATLSFYAPDGILDGTVSQFILPGFKTDPDSLPAIGTYENEKCADVKVEGEVFTLTWNDCAESATNFGGDIYIDVLLTDEVKEVITAPSSIEFISYTPKHKFRNTLDFIAEPTNAPYRYVYLDEEQYPVWVVDIPGTLGAWSSVEISSDEFSEDYNFLCDEFKNSIGTELDAFRNATVFKASSWDSSSSCEANAYHMVYTDAIETDEVFRFRVRASPISGVERVFNVMTVKVTKSSGSYRSFYLNDDISLYPLNDVFELYAGMDPPETTDEPTQELTTSNESSSGATKSVKTSDCTSSTSESPEQSSSSSLEPTITGSIIDGNPQWQVNVPGGIGPWNSIEFAGLADEGFLFNDVNYSVDGATFPINSTLIRSVNFTSERFSEDGLSAHFGGHFVSGEFFSINVTVTISTPDQDRLAKREIIVYELSDTISMNESSSSSLSSFTESSVATSSSSTVTSTRSIATDDANKSTVITITSCEKNTCSEIAISTGLTVATTTVHGVVSEYTTYCPIPTPNTTKGPETIVLSITSCDDNRCTEKEVTTTHYKEASSKVSGKRTTLPDSILSRISKASINGLPNTSITIAHIGNTKTTAIVTAIDVSKASTGSYSLFQGATTTQAITTFAGAANSKKSGLYLLAVPFFFLL